MTKAAELDGFKKRANMFFTGAIERDYKKKKDWKPKNYHRNDSYGTPMDIDVVNAGRQHNHEHKKGTCYGCGQEGHYIADCPRDKGKRPNRDGQQRQQNQASGSRPNQKRFQGNRNGGKPFSGPRKPEDTRKAIREIITESYQNEESEEYLEFLKQVKEQGF
jgi:hypothetical protein